MSRTDSQTYTLASAASATGAAVPIRGGEYMFMAEGTPVGSTISLQMQTPNGTWVDVQVFAASAVKSATLPFTQTGIDLPAGNVRMAATGGTPTGLFAYLCGVG
jgi:hypothetical protein